MDDFNDDYDSDEMAELADVERKARREDVLPGPMMMADEFIGQVIGIGRLDRFALEITHDHPSPECKARCTCTLWFPDSNRAVQFEGVGLTVGYAMRATREEIRLETGR